MIFSTSRAANEDPTVPAPRGGDLPEVRATVATPRESAFVELTWPWGKERICESLRIGRHPPAPPELTEKIRAYGYDNISRAHANIVFNQVEKRLWVVDLGSTNGTYVDGTRIPPNQPTPLAQGSVIQFAAGLTVEVSAVHDCTASAGHSASAHPTTQNPHQGLSFAASVAAAT